MTSPRFHRRLGSIGFILIAFSHSLFPQQAKPWLRRAFPSLTADNALWIGTPKGLYRYQYEDDTWAVFGMHTGLPSDDIQLLTWDGEWLWVGTPAGVAAGDVKLNKWLMYNAQNGLPSSRVLSIASEPDYVWVGTDRGAARYDKLIQEWERFTHGSGLPDSTVYDIVVDGKWVYFATAGGLAEYDVQFEKWRTYGAENGIPSDTVRFLYPTAEYLWLFTDRGPARFNKKLHTSVPYSDPRLRFTEIQDLAVENETMWMATRAGVVVYDPANSMWRDYTEAANLPDPSVRAFCFSPEARWFVTKKGVAVQDTKDKSWRRIDRAQGLASESYDAAAVFLGRVFLVNPETIDHYRPLENRWYNYPLAEAVSRKGSGPRFSLDREKGSYVQFGEGIRLSLSGTRFTERIDGSKTVRPGTGADAWTTRTVRRTDLKVQVQAPGGQTWNGFYDNTDPFNQTLYGLKYRGADSDLVQEAAWGDVRIEQGKNELLPALGIFGTMARLEAGAKTERYKRSLVSARGLSGERTSARETEFFTGNLRSGGAVVRDVQYVRHAFFRIDSSSACLPIDEGSESVFLDDGDPRTNSANTAVGAVVSGIEGDFDRLHAVVEYRFDRNRGILWCLLPVPESAVLIVQGSTRGIPFERILKTPGRWEQALVNRYSVQGMDLLPHSFRLDVFDASGAKHPLSEFGLDRDADGRVDPDRIDTRDGILAFPADRPFPASVYESENPVSHYSMRVQFQAEIPSFSLKHGRLLRGSEKVLVEGERLIPGADYILDYTVGTLFILKEGTVAEDSEIQVDYEYILDYRAASRPAGHEQIPAAKDVFHQVGVGYGPSDNMLVELNAFGFDTGDPDGTQEFTRGVDVFGEFRTRVRGVDVKVTPQVAANGLSGLDGKAVHLRTDLSSAAFRLSSAYEKFDSEYRQMFDRKFQLGRLGERTAVEGTVYPVSWMDVAAGWSRQATLPDHRGSDVEEDWNAKVLINRSRFPAVSLSLRKRTFDTQALRSDKKTLRGDLEYRLPPALLRKIAFQSLHVVGVWRQSWEQAVWLAEPALGWFPRKVYANHYFRVDCSPAERVQIDAYYRGSRNRGGEGFTVLGRFPYLQKQKLFLTATVDRLDGMNYFLLYQGESSEQRASPFARTANRSLNRSLLSMLRINPGRWIQFLSPFTFELDYQPSYRAFVRNSEESSGFLDRFWRFPSGEEPSFLESARAVTFRNEWRPSGSVTAYLDFEMGEGESVLWGSRLPSHRRRVYGKTEIRPSMFSLFTLQVQRIEDEKESYSKFVTDNPVVWMEYRWSEALQTKCSVSLWREHRRIGRTEETLANISPLAGFTLRLRRSGMRLEFRDDLSAAFVRNQKPGFQLDFNQYSNAVSIDVFPASVLVFRLKAAASYRDRLITGDDYWTLEFEGRLTAQF